MYDFIINPVNGKKIKTNSKQGKAIIEKYRKEYNKKNGGGFGTIEEISCLMAGKIKKYMKFGKYDLDGNINPRIRLIDAFKNLIDFDPKIEDGLTDIEEKSKRLFHNEWKKLQRYHQLREEAFYDFDNYQKKQLSILSYFAIPGPTNPIQKKYNDLYPVQGTIQFTEFSDFFIDVILNIDPSSEIRKHYSKLIPYAKYISFDLYIQSVLPRACKLSKANPFGNKFDPFASQTENESFEKNPFYFLNQTIDKIPDNYLRMYRKTLTNKWTEIYQEQIPQQIEAKDESKPEKQESIQRRNNLKRIFIETGFFYNEHNKITNKLSRIDERVWKLIWQLGYIQANFDYHQYTKKSQSETHDRHKITKIALKNELMRLITASVASVAGVAVALATGPVIPATASAFSVLMATGPVVDTLGAVAKDIATMHVNEIYEQYASLLDKQVNLSGKGPELQIQIPYYELPHFAGYYFALSEIHLSKKIRSAMY